MALTFHPWETAAEAAENDGIIIARSLRDPDAFRRIFERHHARVRRYTVSRLGPESGSDVVSDVFLHAFAKRTNFDRQQPSALPWLLGISTKLISNHRRRERRWLQALQLHVEVERELSEQRTESGDAFGAPGIQLQRTAEHGVETRTLAVALSRLSPKLRDAFLLHVLSECSYEEIATALEVPIGTVRSRINRARAQLHATLEVRDA